MKNNVIKEKIRWLVDTRENGNKSAFGAKLGTRSGLVHDWIRGRSKPGYDYRQKICKAYDVPMEWLNSPDMTPPEQFEKIESQFPESEHAAATTPPQPETATQQPTAGTPEERALRIMERPQQQMDRVLLMCERYQDQYDRQLALSEKMANYLDSLAKRNAGKQGSPEWPQNHNVTRGRSIHKRTEVEHGHDPESGKG